MNIEDSNPALKKQEDAAKLDLSLSDWRPGSGLQNKEELELLDAFTSGQREKLLQLRTALINSMKKVRSAAARHPGG